MFLCLILHLDQEISRDMIRYQEFDKNDDDNYHMDFIEIFTKIKAENFRIEIIDRPKIQSFVGAIVSSTILSTTIAVSLQIIEILKYLSHLSDEIFRGYTINLANCSFVPIQLEKCKPSLILESKQKLHHFNKWSLIDIKGPMTVKGIFDFLRDEYDIEVKLISDANSMFINDTEDDDYHKFPEEVILKKIEGNIPKKFIFEVQGVRDYKNSRVDDFPPIRYTI